MPAKKKQTFGDWKGFVNCDLTPEDKATFRVWDVDANDAFDLIMGRCVEGYKLTITHNKGNDNFVASLTGQADNGDNQGYTLSAFGKDALLAVRVLAFKDQFVLEGNWKAAATAAKDDIG